MRAVLIDTAVFAYALGGEHRYRSSCRRVLEMARDGEVRLHASVEMVQELLFHRMRMTGREQAVTQARAAGRSCVLHDFDQRVLERSLEIVRSTPIRGRDAVHVATAELAGLSVIVTPDAAFDTLLTRLDPLDM